MLKAEAIFCAVETSGDGAVNFYSRVQMYMFKARERARIEYSNALAHYGITEAQVREFLADNPKYTSTFFKAPHVVAGTGADLIHEVNKHENPAVNIENFAAFIFGIALMLLIKTMLE